MDKLQKAGVWLWYNKERMVLIAMLVTLGYRGYQVFSPPPPPNWERLQMPKDIFPEEPAELEGLNIRKMELHILAQREHSFSAFIFTRIRDTCATSAV